MQAQNQLRLVHIQPFVLGLCLLFALAAGAVGGYELRDVYVSGPRFATASQERPALRIDEVARHSATERSEELTAAGSDFAVDVFRHSASERAGALFTASAFLDDVEAHANQERADLRH